MKGLIMGRLKSPLTATMMFLGPIFLLILCDSFLPAAELDLTKAVVVTTAEPSKQEKKALALLVEEVEKRTQIRWQISSTWPTAPTPVIAVGPISKLGQFA